MSELLRIDGIKADAEAAADAGKQSDACPKDLDPRRAQFWLHFFYQRQEQNERVAA